MSYKLLTTEVVDATPELAREFAESPHYVGERPLKEKRLFQMRRWITDGTWTNAKWATCAVKESGKTYRVNGQHSSHALVEAGDKGEFPFGTKAIIERYECDSNGDLSLVFDLFDNPLAARSNSDKFAFYAGEHDDLRGMDFGILGSMCNGIARYYKMRVQQDRKDNPDAAPQTFDARERGMWLKEPTVRDFLRWAYTFRTEGKIARVLQQAEVVQAMFDSWISDADIARKFWDESINGTNPDPDDPTRELHLKLTKEIAVGKQRRKPNVLLGACVKAFRQFRKYNTPTQIAA